MQKNIVKLGLITAGVFASVWVMGQETLSKKDVVSLAMEYNFDIQISNNNMEVAHNNASMQNSQFIPSVSGSAGANYSNTSGTVTEKSGSESDYAGNETSGLNATIGVNYTVFDGFGRSNTYKKLQENYQISELQARQMVELTLLDIFSSYYEIARLTQDVTNQKQTLTISRIRLQRASYTVEYAQGSQLDVLNAEVDYNNDSITYLTNTQLLANEKRNLNLLIGRDVNVDFTVDTALTYAQGLLLESLLVHSKENNVALLQQERALRNAMYDIKTTQSGAIPKLSVNANYGWNDNQMGSISFINHSMSTGPNLGATLSWNIYDGGATRIRKQNSVIVYENQNVNLQKQKLIVERDLSNAWTIYQTSLFIRDAQNKNLETAQTNFDRSVDQYKLGQITNIVFRQAQLNLLNAQLALNQAKYTAKTAELSVLQISGDLNLAEF